MAATLIERRHHFMALKDSVSLAKIDTAGGMAAICDQGTPDLTTLYQADGSSQTNPVPLSAGVLEFHTGVDVDSVDIYLKSPTGHFAVYEALKPREHNELCINTAIMQCMAKVPYSFAQGLTEIDTGFDFLVNEIIQPEGIGALVTAADAGMSIDIGLLSTETGGDIDGFVDGLDIATTGRKIAGPALTVGSNETFFASNTLGVLLSTFLAGTDLATDVGTFNANQHICDGTAKSLVFDLSASADTAKGFLMVPYLVAGPVIHA